MSIEVDDLTPKDPAGGSEVIPVSDSGSPKSLTPSVISDYIIDQIEAISAAVAVTGADSVFVMQGGDMKPADIDLVAQHAIDTVWAKAAEASPDDADIMALKDGGTTEKTVTLAVLAEYVRATVEAAILDVSDLSEHSSLVAANKFLVTDGTTGKYCTFTTLSDAVFTALKDYVTALSAVTVSSDTDVFYVIQGGVEKKVTLAEIRTQLGGDCNAPASTTEDKVPQWDSSQKTLKDGLTFRTTVRDTGSTDHTSLASEAAIRTAIDAGQGSIEVDGTLPTGDNNSFDPSKLLYTKTCSDSDGDDVIDLLDNTTNGFRTCIYLGTKAGSDNAVITPVTSLAFTTITLDQVGLIAVMQWMGSTVGWVVIYTNGTVA